MKFTDFYWHDAIIKNIVIDRHKPGIKDEIEMEILWPNSEMKDLFIFEEVYWAKFNLNFGITAPENIKQVSVIEDDDEDLSTIYSKWKDSIDNIKLYVYKIILNSTGGEIKIIAKGFKIIKHNMHTRIFT